MNITMLKRCRMHVTPRGPAMKRMTARKAKSTAQGRAQLYKLTTGILSFSTNSPTSFAL